MQVLGICKDCYMQTKILIPIFNIFRVLIELKPNKKKWNNKLNPNQNNKLNPNPLKD